MSESNPSLSGSVGTGESNPSLNGSVETGESNSSLSGISNILDAVSDTTERRYPLLVLVTRKRPYRL